jgi:hypothetical protein
MWAPKRISFWEGGKRVLRTFESNGLGGRLRRPFYAPSNTSEYGYHIMKRKQGLHTANQGRQEPERLLTAVDVARITGLSTETLAQWRSQRRGIPFVKLSRNVVRYWPCDLDEWLAAHLVRFEAERPRGAGG